MATLIKVRHMPLLQRCLWNRINALSRNIATSKKNSDAAAAECQVTPNKNWVSYGFDYKDQENDTNVHHASFFFSVTVCLVFGGFLWTYSPDPSMRDWAQREAFLELRRREKARLPLIDPNYVSPSSVKLPSESDLADVEIII